MEKRRKSALIDTGVIWCGDCLEKLQDFPTASVDLIYIDPPFNSNRDYECFWGEAKEKRAFEDRHGSTRAYLEYMRPRCAELFRVLKKNGSLYYHCDWHASHYVKVMLDELVGENQFRSEIIWRRTNAKGLASRGYPNNHDTIFYYTTGPEFTWNRPFKDYNPAYVEKFYRFVEPETGRRYQLDNLVNPAHCRPNLTYEFLGVKRVWRWTRERMQKAYDAGLILQSRSGAVPRYKRYLDEGNGQPIDTLWDDIPPIQAQSDERVGYPTQKPVTLLKRIIETSSSPGDIVLDAFCGCGTALEAAETLKLKRQWIGIDSSPSACAVMGKRLRDKCGLRESEELWRSGRGFVIRDIPKTEGQLRKMPHFEFEHWAVISLNGMPNQAQVGDMGIDGRIYLPSPLRKGPKSETDSLFSHWYPVQVKQKDKAGRPDIDQFETAMLREERTKGFFVSFGFTSDALSEIERFRRHTGNRIVPLTVSEILTGEAARLSTRRFSGRVGTVRA